MKSLILGLGVIILLTLTGCGNLSTNTETNDSTIPPLLTMNPPSSDLSHTIRFSGKTWMGQINDDIAISDITMTGTHDSATYNYTTSLGSSKFVRTQNKTITEQLEMGVRVFDLRVRIDEDNEYVGMTHGSYDLGIGFQTVLIDFKNFLKANPSEALIIIIKKEDSDWISNRAFAIRVYDKMKGMNSSLSHFYLKKNTIPKLGELRGKMLVLRRDDIGDLARDYGSRLSYPNGDKGNIHKTSGFRYYTQDWWEIDYNNNYKDHPDDDVWKKLELITKGMNLALNETNETVDRLYINYASCADGPDHGVNTLAAAINPELDTFVKSKRGHGHGGVVMVDFVADRLAKHITEVNSVNFEPWTKRYKIDEHIGSENSGGGITIGDTDGDGVNNLIISYIDNPKGENTMYYRTSSNIKSDATVDKWSKQRTIGKVGSESSGAGLAIGDTDGDGVNNLIISYIDNPKDDNTMYYRTSSNIKSDGTVDSWYPRRTIGKVGHESSGAGLAIGDTDDDGVNNLIISYIDNPKDDNTMYYRTSSNIKSDGTVDSWYQNIKIANVGHESSGAGVAIGDIDNDGVNNLIISYIDNPRGINKAYYRVSTNVGNGKVISWHDSKKIYGFYGNETSGAGITIGNVDGGNSNDLILYFIDNPSGENRGYYKVGFNDEQSRVFF